MYKILVDCDPGIDDAIALLYLFKRKDVKVMGITTGFGNTSARQGADNVLRLIKLAGVDYHIPVGIGAEFPLKRDDKRPNYPVHIHGEDGLGNVDLPMPDEEYEYEDAVTLINRVAKENPGEVILITLGPFTNLAKALEKEANLPKLYKQVVSMGGTVYREGNVSPVAEANIKSDPEAADQVFQAGFNLCMVGLDVTMETWITWQDLLNVESILTNDRDTQIIKFLKEAVELYMEYHRSYCLGIKTCPVHDPAAVLMALEPHLYVTKTMKARVELDGSFTRGQIVVDNRPLPLGFDAKPVTFALGVDSKKAIDALLYGLICNSEVEVN